MPKFNDNTARDLRSYIQNLIIDEQRSGVTLAQIEFPPIPDYPDKITLLEVIKNARKTVAPKLTSEEDDKSIDAKDSFFAKLMEGLSSRRQNKADRRALKLVYKLTCKGKAVRYEVERRIGLEKILAYSTVLDYVESMYIDNEDIFNAAGGTVSAPIPMHSN